MRGLILTLVCSLALVACAFSKADRPEIKNFEMVSPTMRLLFPLDDVTLTATITRTPTITPTRTITPIGYKSPTPTNTLVPIFPIESTDTPVYYYCRSSPGGASNIQGVIWVDKNRDGLRQSGESGIGGIRVDVRHSGSSVLTDNDGKYELPVQSDDWPVIVQPPNTQYSFDVQTQDSRIGYVTDKGAGALCAGSSYDVGLVPPLVIPQAGKTKGPGGDQGNPPPPSCSQEPNNPNCTP